MCEFAKTCERAARAGGEVLKAWRGKFTAREKGPSDLVTDADLASQETISKIVLGAFPDHQFVGEEDPNAVGERDGYCWIVDPLDGTTNYVHGVPHYATSVALVCDNRLVVAAIHDPCREECFTAIAGEGSWLNGEPIRTSGEAKLSQALVAASFPAQSSEALPTIDEFLRVLPACQSLQRSGSAALNMAYLAAGRYDGYWATDLKAWDAAAGALLIREAGGVITGRSGAEFDVWHPKLVAAASAALHEEILGLLA